MLQKRPFQKSTVVYDTKEDFGFSQSHKFEFWNDPSRTVIFGLLDVVSTKEDKLDKMSEEDKKKLDDDFWGYVSQLIIDCDIEGLDFSTPQAAKDSFEKPYVDWGFMYSTLISFVGKLMATNERLGNIVALLTKAAKA